MNQQCNSSLSPYSLLRLPSLPSYANQKPAGLSRPSHEDRVAGASDADVKQLALLLKKIGVRLFVSLFAEHGGRRQFILCGVDHKDDLEFEPLGPMHSAEVDGGFVREIFFAQAVRGDTRALKPGFDLIEEHCLACENSVLLRVVC